MSSDLLGDLLVIFAVGVAAVTILRQLKLPPIAGFILAGTLVGPHALGWVKERQQVETLAEIGVALLLFGIGLELQLARLRRMWQPVLIGGALQVGLTTFIAAGIAAQMGLGLRSSIFLGFILAASSTAIVLRGLTSRGELEAPHGRLTLGVLIFQDLSVVPMILALPLLAGTDLAPGSTLLLAALKAGAVLAGVLVAAWFIVPRLLHLIAQTRQRDLFVLTVFLVCIGTAWVAAYAGISLALGAFLAGLVVAGSDYRHQALAELIPFREVLTSLFFVSVGMLLDPSVLWRAPAAVFGLLAAIMFGKFNIMILATRLMRMPPRVCVLASAALAQVGEFAFVLLHAAKGSDLVPPGLAQPLLPAIILSMLITPVALALGPALAASAARWPLMQRLGIRGTQDMVAAAAPLSGHVIIAGLGVAGEELARSLRACGIAHVIVDLNPDNVRRAAAAGEPAYFGDITSPEVLQHLGATRAREIVLVINDPNAAERAAAAIRGVAPQVHVLVRARYLGDVDALMRAGASEVVPAELEAAVEVTARVLARHSVDAGAIDEQLARVRLRRREA